MSALTVTIALINIYFGGDIKTAMVFKKIFILYMCMYRYIQLTSKQNNLFPTFLTLTDILSGRGLSSWNVIMDIHRSRIPGVKLKNRSSGSLDTSQFPLCNTSM